MTLKSLHTSRLPLTSNWQAPVIYNSKKLAQDEMFWEAIDIVIQIMFRISIKQKKKSGFFVGHPQIKTTNLIIFGLGDPSVAVPRAVTEIAGLAVLFRTIV